MTNVLWTNKRFAQRFIVAIAVVLTTAKVQADSPKILRIEEQWELQVGAPDAERSAPQATMVVAPYADLDSTYFLFTLNHRNAGNYQPGGMQVQMWSGNELVGSCTAPEEGTLNAADDVIRWTERLQVNDGTLTFEVVDGSSVSWGNFAGEGSLRISTPTPLHNLSGYRPAVSLGESKVGYAGNRVVALVLKKLTWYTDDGEVHQLTAPIDIDTDIDP